MGLGLVGGGFRVGFEEGLEMVYGCIAGFRVVTKVGLGLTPGIYWGHSVATTPFIVACIG